ncbi:LIMR family protein [Dendrobium catenatum]|uniref:LIMR family protein n=1 Tax=Dendrobium catenatum TaxID=906689 RepID=A0A2I0WFZ6_9ASPA|nr:LIMR family protein [Dendrobium catenatum]
MALVLVGKIYFNVRHLSSASTNFPTSWTEFSRSQPCIGSTAHQCAAYLASASSESTRTMRASFPEYVVSLATIVGSVLSRKGIEYHDSLNLLLIEDLLMKFVNFRMSKYNDMHKILH